MKYISLLTLFFMMGGAFAQIAKPLSENYVHDPVVIKQGDDYYLFCTGNGITVYSSKDLNRWKPESQVFDKAPDWTNKVVADFKNHIWAPDISYHNGMYYLYYSVSSFAKNASAIGVATNKTLDRNSKDFNWQDHGIVIESVPNRDMWNAIDPNLIFDENNTPYLSFGSFWNGLKLVKLNQDLKTIAEPQEWHTIAKRERSFKLEDNDPGDAALEAPFIFKKNGYYYLFVSFDLCCRGKESTYKVVVGRSTKLTGPYLDENGISMNQGGGKLLIEGNNNWYGAGHNAVYTFNGKDYIFYHAYDAHKNGFPVGQKSELIWINGWPSLANPLP